MIALYALTVFILTGCGNTIDFSSAENYDTTAFEAEITTTGEQEESEKADMEKIFNCDAQRLNTGMSGAEVTRLYQQACADGKENGYVPVIVFVDDVLEDFIEGIYEKEGGSESYINSMLSVEYSNGKELFDERYAQLESYYGEEFISIDNDLLDMWLSLDSNGQESCLPALDAFEGEAYLIHVPTDKPYEIFAWLPFGGWNECPDTDIMIAMCKYWYDEYGAKPAIITHDTLTFYLNEPITSKETAVLIAKEQCAFCSEALGMGGMASYVAMTLDSNVWTFWWD